MGGQQSRSERQRRDARAEARQRLWCEGQSLSAGEMRNVSRSGMFIVAEHAPAVGQQVTVSFTDELAREVEVEMEVVRHGATTASDRPGMGVRIVSFRKGQEAYDRFVSRHLAEEEERERAVG